MREYKHIMRKGVGNSQGAMNWGIDCSVFTAPQELCLRVITPSCRNKFWQLGKPSHSNYKVNLSTFKKTILNEKPEEGIKGSKLMTKMSQAVTLDTNKSEKIMEI